jgi:hypothetical protein
VITLPLGVGIPYFLKYSFASYSRSFNVFALSRDRKCVAPLILVLGDASEEYIDQFYTGKRAAVAGDHTEWMR